MSLLKTCESIFFFLTVWRLSTDFVDDLFGLGGVLHTAKPDSWWSAPRWSLPPRFECHEEFSCEFYYLVEIESQIQNLFPPFYRGVSVCLIHKQNGKQISWHTPFQETMSRDFYHDCTGIGNEPQVQDPYEASMVHVDKSGTEGAGEGLFASRDVSPRWVITNSQPWCAP